MNYIGKILKFLRVFLYVWFFAYLCFAVYGALLSVKESGKHNFAQKILHRITTFVGLLVFSGRSFKKIIAAFRYLFKNTDDESGDEMMRVFKAKNNKLLQMRFHTFMYRVILPLNILSAVYYIYGTVVDFDCFVNTQLEWVAWGDLVFNCTLIPVSIIAIIGLRRKTTVGYCALIAVLALRVAGGFYTSAVLGWYTDAGLSAWSSFTWVAALSATVFLYYRKRRYLFYTNAMDQTGGSK